MIRFCIIMMIVGAVTAYFWGPSAAIKLGPQVLDYWILAGLAVVLLSPVIYLFKLTWFLFKRILHNRKPVKEL